MPTFNRYLILGCMPALAALAACGSFDRSAKKPAKQAADAQAVAADTSKLEVLSPGELAQKIYAAFGPGMTQTKRGDQTADYLLLNESNFVGSISSDPSNRYASAFSIGYFMALAGLAQVVGDNYTAAMGRGALPNDCRQDPGAEAILFGIAPTLTQAETTAAAAQLVTACRDNASAAVAALIQSYSMALKSAI